MAQGAHPALTQALPLTARARVAELRRQAGGRSVYLAYRAGSVVARALPARAGEAAAEAAGMVMARAMRGRRAMLERHLRRVHGPQLAGDDLDRAVRRTFASYGRYWVESFRLPGETPAHLQAHVTSEGLELVQEAVAAGRGVILAMPHLGGWDVGGAWMASLGLPMVAVMEDLQPPELFRWIADLRRAIGLEVIPLGSGVGTAVLQRLEKGAVVALVCDRDLEGTGIEVEFFGERTTLPGGPAVLALRSGALLLPATVYFRPGGHHHAVMGPPVNTARQSSFRKDVNRVAQAVASELERLIRAAPDQWHLLQPNWPSDRAPVAPTVVPE
ncbi:MAG TPA: phosphatidylinositol mannoside acyltransferase [Acidimicrobiales bacterium]|nr:phosphatidylinositol mannoside acyltransferase [Acidimicrobiales bacterium]